MPLARPPTSIIRRLTSWYFSALFALTAASSGYLYWSLSRELASGAQYTLEERVRTVGRLLEQPSDPLEAARRRIEVEWPARRYDRTYVQISEVGGQTIIHSPETPETLKSEIFPTLEHSSDRPARVRTSDGSSYFVQVKLVARAGAPALLVRAALETTREEAILSGYRSRLVIVVITLLMISLWIGRRLAVESFRPIDKMAAKTQEIRSSTLHQRFEPNEVPIELRGLASTINEMLDRLEDSFSRLSRFSADIAHELRTPINNLRGEIEVALGKDRAAKDYAETLRSALEESIRISRIIDSLLFLARAEDPSHQARKENTSVGDEVGKIIEFYEPSATEEGIALTADVPASLLARVEKTLFQRALSNLVSNSIDHTARGGWVKVIVRTIAGALSVVVEDNGQGIAKEDLPWVTDRFYRADAARIQRKLGGSGLGLSIVQSIVKMHGGHLNITSEPGKGTRVELKFPDAIEASYETAES